MSAAGDVPHVFDVLFGQKLIHAFDPVKSRIFSATADPQHLQLLIEHGGVRLLPFRAIASAAERGDIRELIQMMQPNLHRLAGAHR